MRNNRSSRLLGVALALGSLAFVAPSVATAGPYVSGGTAVFRQNGETQADKGVVTCSVSLGTGVGGGCIPFGLFNSIKVNDVVGGAKVAFQVCVDNNGDGACTDNGKRGDGTACADDVFFSHADGGAFFNPLGPLPTGFAPGCPGNLTGHGFPGYVVFLCEGLHVEGDSAGGTSAHVHPATTGTISASTSGTGYGNFCGASQGKVVEKNYEVIS